MLKIIIIALFIWLLIKTLGLAFKLTWGLAKVIACVLMVAAFPVLAICLLFAGGIVLLAPVLLIAIAAVILKACL